VPGVGGGPIDGGGKSGSVLHNPAMKWFLNTRMARSAELRRWACGGTSW
jgi:hypothetical protein